MKQKASVTTLCQPHAFMASSEASDTGATYAPTVDGDAPSTEAPDSENLAEEIDGGYVWDTDDDEWVVAPKGLFSSTSGIGAEEEQPKPETEEVVEETDHDGDNGPEFKVRRRARQRRRRNKRWLDAKALGEPLPYTTNFVPVAYGATKGTTLYRQLA